TPGRGQRFPGTDMKTVWTFKNQLRKVNEKEQSPRTIPKEEKRLIFHSCHLMILIIIKNTNGKTIS
ncbi:hypothetical protein V4Y02_24205, partial [Escherichia coli]